MSFACRQPHLPTLSIARVKFLEQPESAGKYQGIYRARVEARVDPKRLYRVRVRVHGIHAPDTPVKKLPWAQPRKDVGKKHGVVWVPVIGTDVWVEFQDGDHEYPVYLGAAPGTDTMIDGKGANKHRFWPTSVFGKKRTSGDLKSESDADGGEEDAPDNFVSVSPLQKRIELDDRKDRERLLLADIHDNFLWFNTERGVVSLEAALGEQTKKGTAKARGITFSSDPDYLAVQLYTFANWQITVDDIGGICEIASPRGALLRIVDTPDRGAIEAWTPGGKRLILDDVTGKMSMQTPDGYGVSVNETQQRVYLFTKDGDQSVLLDRKNKKLRLFSTETLELASVKDLVLESGQDIILNPKRLLQLDKKKGDVTVVKDQATHDQESAQISKPERRSKVKRACDYPFYQDK